MKGRRRPKITLFRFLVALLLSPVVMLGMGALWRVWVDFKADRATETLLADLEAKGIPTVVEDFFPKVENPAEDMMQHPAILREFALPGHQRFEMNIHQILKERVPGCVGPYEAGKRRSQGWVPDCRDFFEPMRHETEQDAARELLDALAPELVQIHPFLEAFERPHASFTASREKGEGNRFDQIEAQKNWILTSTVFILGEIIDLQMALGDPDEVMPLIHALWSIHRHMCEPPVYIVDAYYSTVAYNIIYHSINHGIARGLWEERHLAEFDRWIANHSPASVFVDCLEGELVFAADRLRQMQQGRGRYPDEWKAKWISNQETYETRYRSLKLHALPRGLQVLRMVESIKSFQQEGLNRDGTPRTDFTMGEYEVFANRRFSPEGVFDRICNFHHETLAYTSKWYLKMQVQHTLLRTGVALERYRLAHETHPTLLAALVPRFLPAVPLDACNGYPMQYRFQSDGLPVVWSVGLDKTDDGGRSGPEKDMDDITWMTALLEGN